jgi:hypothetical protein
MTELGRDRTMVAEVEQGKVGEGGAARSYRPIAMEEGCSQEYALGERVH